MMQKRVLVVDDDAHVLRIAEVNFQAAGWQVMVARSPQTVPGIVRQWRPHVLVLDVVMAGLDGHQLATALRAMPEAAEVPIIFVSAKAQDQDELLGLQAGGTVYLTKPFSPMHLVAVADHLLLKSPAERREQTHHLLSAAQQRTLPGSIPDLGAHAQHLHRTRGLVEGEPVVIGAILPLTSALAHLGQPERQGLELAVSRINMFGGIWGHPIQIILCDDQGDPRRAVSLARHLTEDRKALALVGCSYTDAGHAVSRYAEETGIPLVVLTGGPSVWQGTRYVFQSTPGLDLDGLVILRWLSELGGVRIGLLAADSSYGREGAEGVRASAAALGLDVVMAGWYDQLGDSFPAQVSFALANPMDAWVVWGSTAAGGMMVKALRNAGVQVPIAVCYSLVTSTFAAICQDAGERIFGHTTLNRASPTPQEQDFILAFQERYKIPPPSQAAWAYDAVHLIREAVDAAGGRLERQAVAAGFTRIRGYNGVLGVYNITPDNHHGVGTESLVRATVRDGGWEEEKHG